MQIEKFASLPREIIEKSVKFYYYELMGIENFASFNKIRFFETVFGKNIAFYSCLGDKNVGANYKGICKI